MQLGEILFQSKASPEFAMKSVWIIANNVQSTAHSRGLRAERRNDDVAAWLDCMRHLAHVCHPVPWVRQEVKDCAVMPHVELMAGKIKSRDIPTEPVDLVRTGTKSFFGHLQRSG